jgi:Ca-activated chloride channel family protein
MTNHHRLLTAFALAGLMLSAGPTRGAEPAATLKVSSGRPWLMADRTQRTFLKVGLEGRESERPGRVPVNLALVLDRSSSMAGDKIAKAKEAALMVLERLSKDDIVSVVTYDSQVEVLVPATRLRDKEEVAARIRALTPRGSTALFAGVSAGIEEVRKFLDNQRVNRVILLSDGQANVGPSSPNELGTLGAAAGKEGVAITTIGLGLGYNEDLMAQIARRSDGNHAFVESAEELAQIFKLELGDVLSVVAQEVAVKVTLPEGVRAVQLLNRTGEIIGQDVFVALNQLYAGQEKYLLLEVEVSPRRAEEVLSLAEVSVSYSALPSGATERLEGRTAARFTRSEAEVARAEDRAVMVAAVEALAVKANREAVALRDQGKVEAAKKKLEDNADYLRSNAARYNSTRLDDYSTQNVQDAENLEGEGWNKRRKSMRKVQHERSTQQSY